LQIFHRLPWQQRFAGCSWKRSSRRLAKQWLLRYQVFDQDLGERFPIGFVKEAPKKDQADEQRQNRCD
jgi:hypothetical protein